MAAGAGIDHLATADGNAGRGLAETVAVAFGNCHLVAQAQLSPSAVAGFEVVRIKESDVAGCLGRAREEIEQVVLLNGSRRIRQEVEVHVEASGGLEPARGGEHHASGKLLYLQTDQIDRHTVAGADGLDLVLVALQPADAALEAGWHNLHFLSHAQGASGEGAGHHGAEARYGESPVHGEARARPVLSGSGVVQEAV